MAAPTNETTTILQLPSDPLLHVLSYLDYKDLVRCCYTCKLLQDIAEHDSLWKLQCKIYWLQNECPEDITWREHFIHFYKNFGKYSSSYKIIKAAWNTIENYMKLYCPSIYESIEDGLSENDIDSLEEKYQVSLPTDMRCSFRIHNGQKMARHTMGLLGSVSVYNHFRSEMLLELQAAAASLQSSEISPSECMKLSHCPRNVKGHYIALSTEDGFKKGEIFIPASNEEMNMHMGSAKYDAFIVAHSFMEWISQYASDLEADVFPRIQGNVYRFYQEPSCIAVTCGITVKVATAFCPELSTVSPPHFLHAYHIMISMDETASKKDTCQLETRHWIITNENGKEERVDGPGVIGEYPIMKPGAKFSYTSCTTFSTTYGNMKGYFTFKNLKTGEKFDVTVPTYHMKCLPYITCSQRKENAELYAKERDKKDK